MAKRNTKYLPSSIYIQWEVMHLVLNNLIFMMIEALASKQKVVLCELKEIQLLVAAATTVWYFLFVRKKSCDSLGMFEHSYMTQLFLNWDEISGF